MAGTLLWVIIVTTLALAPSQGQTIEVFQQRVVVNSSELCVLPITPTLFKWNAGGLGKIEYTAMMSGVPDLPSWLHFNYDKRNSVGYLYGVPPNHLISLTLDVIATNRFLNNEVRRLIISMEIMRRSKLRYVAEIKVDNSSVTDLCNTRRMNQLVSILSRDLNWRRNDGSPVTPVYMASAVEIGENRVPLRADEPEGVVVHFASDKSFSRELKRLHLETLPLTKLRPCPKDLKRTSMERHFRRYKFLMDWCYFHLITHKNDTNFSEEEAITFGAKGDIDAARERYGEEKRMLPNIDASEPETFDFKSEVPIRDYGLDALFATLIPGSIGGLMGIVLIIILRDDHDEEAGVWRRGKDACNNSSKNNDRGYVTYQPAPQHDLDSAAHLVQSSSTPVPPQYTETHPNGAPALTYAV